MRMRAIDPLTEPIVKLYSAMQEDLIREIARRFDGYEKVTGALLWQVTMLSQTRALDADLVAVIARYSKKSETQIRRMLERAGFANLDPAALSRAYRMGYLSADPAQLTKSVPIRTLIDQSYRELNGTFRLIRTRALESARTAYMTAINRAYVEAASGVYDAPTAIRRAVQDMAAKGITGATYQRSDGTIVRYDLEGVARRDTLTAAHRLANDVSHEACEQIGATHVEVSSHIGAQVSLKDPIANHVGWQGKIYRIDGADEYPNLREKTGYPDEIQGLGGVNCRHRMYPFIPGVSVPAQRDVDPAENERLYRLMQRQRRYEREIRKLKRQKAAAIAMGDEESAKRLSAKLKEKQLAMNRFCEQNGLKRDWNREAVAQEMQPKNAGFDYGTDDESFSRIAGDHSVDEDIRAANPNYATGERRWTMNCQRTAPAYEMRRRGYDVTAKPLPDHYETDPLAAAGGCFEAFENAEVIRVPLGNGRKQIEEQMAKWGDGARAMIRIRNLGNGFGHAFCCEQISGKTVYVDPQRGLTDVRDLWTKAQGGATMFARVDQLKPSDLMADCCKTVEE